MNLKKISMHTNILVFIIVVFLLGFFSFINLVRFYVNDEVDYNEWTADLGNKFETDEATTFAGKFEFVNLNGAMRNLIGQREMHGLVKLMNGHLIYPQEKMSEEEIEMYVDGVIKYAQFCKSKGKYVLFVQPNLKVDEENKQLPIGVEDYSNENINAFLQYLRGSGVDVLDIRECMKNDGLDIYDYTYVTDHHWTTEGGFYAFTKITEWVEEETGVSVNQDVTDINKYDIQKYKNWHLGTYGQRVGKYFAGIDDYDLILPTFNVSFIDETGKESSFLDQVVNTSVFEKQNPKSRYTYDFAMEVPSGISTTSKRLSILMISDSYVKAMAPYLKLAYSDYDYQYYMNGLYADYVNQVDPDVIVLMPFYTSSLDAGTEFYEVTK